MAFPLLSPARTVLLVSDDVLCIYKVSQRASRMVKAVAWNDPGFEGTVLQTVRRHGGRNPVLILNDMTDQHFKGGQRIPRVGVMDKRAVVMRRLQMAFPNYPIRGYLSQRTGGRVGGDVTYLFAAVPMSDQVGKAIALSRNAAPSMSGFVSLPVESSDMVSAFSAKLAGKGRPKAKWTIFIGQHHGGGLRQVIVREGHLAMTRMTPVIDDDGDANRWATEVAQEFRSTLSYLSRFGFSTEDGVDLLVVSSPEAGDRLGGMIDIPCNYTSFTVNEAARMLGIAIGLQEEQRYADPLHAAWAGRKARFIMPMSVRELEKIQRPRQVAGLAIAALLLGAGWFGLQAFMNMQALSTHAAEERTQTAALSRARAELNAEVDRLSALGIDVRLVQAGIRTYRGLEDMTMDPLALIKRIGDGLGPELRIDELTLSLVDGAPASDADTFDPYSGAADVKAAKDVSAVITLSAPATLDVEIVRREFAELERRLVASFPGYRVRSLAEVGGMDYTENIQGAIGTSRTNQEKDYMTEIEIRGSVR